MLAEEFDKFADEYIAVHGRNVRLSGEGPEYFSRYKIEELRRRWTAWRRPEPDAILDFGCGIGGSLPHLARAFPRARLTGLDVSARSLAIAAQRFPEVANLVHHDGGVALPMGSGSCDLVFSACVFHHIPASAQVPMLGELRRILRPGGLLVVFEHNPANPVTRYMVASCPFDENAVLLRPATLEVRLREAGFASPTIRFIGFFPRQLLALRAAERWFTRLPVGAQYYAAAQA